MSQWHRAILLLVSVILFACGTTAPKRPQVSQAGDYAATLAYLDQFLSKEMQAGKAQGISIALVDDQRILWSKGFGLAYSEPKTPATPGTIYRVGSISKLFTATALLKLREQGKADLDAPLRQYLPEFTIKSLYPDAPPITLRHLLTHHSGLPRDYYKGALVLRPEEAVANFNALPTNLAGEYLQAPPNAFYSYSNVGFSLLGHVVAKASGISYSDYIQDSLFHPMGMAHASVLYKPELDPWIAKARVGKKELGGSDINISDLSAGAAFASAEDLARFMQMIFADGKSGGLRILEKGSLDSMLAQQNAGIRADENVRIGLGYLLSRIAIGGNDSLDLFLHTGGVPGFMSYFVGSRSLKVGVVVLVNGGEVLRIGNEALSALLDAKLGRKLPAPQTKESREVILSPTRLDSMTGKFGMHLNAFGITRVDIHRDGKHLSALIDGEKKVTLIPSGHDTFRVRNYLAGFIPIPLHGNGLYLHPIDDRKWVVGVVGGDPLGLVEKLLADSVPTVWRRRAGQYLGLNPDINPFQSAPGKLELIYDSREGLMRVKWNGTVAVPLKILSATEAVSYGKMQGYHVSLEKGKEYISVSGLKFGRIESPISK